MSIDEYSTSKKFDEEEKFPFENIDKIQVLQESRVFSEHKPNPRKCVHIISKILFLLGKGVILKKEESTDLFVKCTMLFGIKNKKLRRMLYVILKELSHTAEQTFIACSSLSTDMNRSDPKKFPFKSNVIRTLRAISDVQTFTSLERHFAEALVDQDPSVSSSSIISGLFISQLKEDIIKRWTKQIVSCMKSRHQMTQYHALALMYKLQSHDHLSVSKLILSQSTSFKSSLAQCLLIRYAVKVLIKEGNGKSDVSEKILKFLDSCLEYKNEMIILEAAKAISSIPFAGEARMSSVVEAIQKNLLSSRFEVSKSVNTFAGLRLLNKMSSKYPNLVFKCSFELERMIKNSNKNISTLAISTLLKCSNNSYDMIKLTEELNSFMTDISDDYKLNVIKSIQALIERSPKHHQAILNFLTKVFAKTEGGYDVKFEVVMTVFKIIEVNSAMIDTAITVLCEFTEDCEYESLLQEILFYVGEYGPKTSKPSICIRYIYNRMYLDYGAVRFAAVEALYKFAIKVPSLKENVLVILKQSIYDYNNDVRDRLMIAIRKLENEKIKNEIETINKQISQIDYELLEENLMDYLENEENLTEEFNISNMKQKTVSKQEEIQRMQNEMDKKSEVKDSSSMYFEIINKVPQLKQLGDVFKTSKETLLTEKEGDYVVTCIKRVYKNHVVLQFNCKNNVKTQKLSTVGIEIDVDDIEGLETAFGLQAKEINYGETKVILVCLNLTKGALPNGNMISNLTFKIYEDDLDPEEFEENEYELEELQFKMSDFLKSTSNTKFKEEWAALDIKNEMIRRVDFPNSFELKDAVEKMENNFGMPPLNEVNYKDIKNNKKKDQALYYCVKLINGDQVLLATKIYKEKGRFKAAVYIRSSSKELREVILNHLF